MVTSVSTSHLWDIIDRVCVANLFHDFTLSIPLSSPFHATFFDLLGTTLPMPQKNPDHSSNTWASLAAWVCKVDSRMPHGVPNDSSVPPGFFATFPMGAWLISILCKALYWAWHYYNCRHITKSYSTFIPLHTNRSILLSLYIVFWVLIVFMLVSVSVLPTFPWLN